MKILSASIIIVLSVYGIATAGPFTDEMSRCIVKKTTESDKTLFIQWIFAAMASHPEVEQMANVSSEKKDTLNKRAANLVMELLTVRCEQECKQAVKYEGEGAFKASFGVLGQVAMQGLMTHSKVAEYLKGLETYFDEDKLKKTFEKSVNE